MKSILIKDTTREERETIVAEALGNIEANCDGCMPGLAEMYQEKPFHVYAVDEYISLIANYIQKLRKDLVLERFVSQSPKDMIIAPHWGLKNYQFTNLLNNYLRKNNIHQGDLEKV
jgi:radical SAM superfamily enzyme